MRIKDIPNFYEKLHAMEEETVVGQKKQVHYLWHIGEDDPRLEELQKMLAVKEGDKYTPMLSREEFNFTVLQEALRQSSNSVPKIAELSNIKRGTLTNKLYRTGKFREAELQRLEGALNLPKGALFK